jgi:hypothetical protein
MFRSLPVDHSEFLERQREMLLQIRARGKTRFILVQGTIWAVVLVVGQNLMGLLIFNKAVDWGFLPISFVIALTCFYGVRFWEWNHNEKRLHKLSAPPQ